MAAKPKRSYVAYLRRVSFVMLALSTISLACFSVLALLPSQGNVIASNLLGIKNLADPNLPITLGVSGAFAALVCFALAVLAVVTAVPPLPGPEPRKITDGENGPISAEGTRGLGLHDILISEFEYARETAAQAMEERRTVINFFLLIIGGAGSGVVALLSTISQRVDLLFGAVALLWVVSIVGLVTLFSVIALRLAWMGSANAMNYIKEFYLDNADDMRVSRDILQSAFFFKSRTLPSAGKRWNANFYAALLIALLDASAFGAGVLFIGLALHEPDLAIVAIGASVLSSILMLGHLWAYDLALENAPMKKTAKG